MAYRILLSFDVEEFDLPREHGEEISLDDGIKVSAEGLEKVLKLCRKQNIKATFFVTGNFAEKKADLIKEIVNDGHEVACHGVDHFKPSDNDICESKKIVEKQAGVKIEGYRQPRMFKINYDELKRCGYKYDSSVNPAWIPGRYDHRDVPRKPFLKKGILEIPTSVATSIRIPLFWLALHIMPTKIYIKLVRMSLKKTGYFATYFHPWEFANLRKFKEVPKYIKWNSGDKLVKRLDTVISKLKKEGQFVSYSEYSETCYNSNYEKGE